MFGRDVSKEEEFRSWLRAVGQPDFLFMHNFSADRSGIFSICSETGVNHLHTEDGFFPHYSNAHVDPLGFCWESSLPRMTFRTVTELQRQRARACRTSWLCFKQSPLPQVVREPFVLWPLQLIGDRVNKWDLNVDRWVGLLRHFRVCLPTTFQLVVKEHPRGKADDGTLAEIIRDLPNTVLISKDTDLKTLLQHCNAVAGANSTVLYEARLIFRKPTYVYARSWFTNHIELFMPIHLRLPPRTLNRVEWIDDNRTMHTQRLNDYSDWFLAQLLARQVDLIRGREDPNWLMGKIHRLSYHSWREHGEDIFNNSE